jgi:hypothetical protein
VLREQLLDKAAHAIDLCPGRVTISEALTAPWHTDKKELRELRRSMGAANKPPNFVRPAMTAWGKSGRLKKGLDGGKSD